MVDTFLKVDDIIEVTKTNVTIRTYTLSDINNRIAKCEQNLLMWKTRKIELEK